MSSAKYSCGCRLRLFLDSNADASFGVFLSRKFAKRHVDLTMIDKDIDHERRRLVLGSFSSLYYVVYEAMAFNDVMALELDLPLRKSSLSEVKLIGSFNGLLCISVAPQGVFVFNPAIKELKRLPNIDINRPSYSRSSRSSIYGFGYVHSLDDYNVVEITYESLSYVYSSKTDTWRRAQYFPYNSFNSDPGIHLNGAVHWVFGRGKDQLASRQRLIVAFDFAERKFQEVPRPSDAADDSATVGVLGGCLCWLTRPAIGAVVEQHDFWVMKEYSVKESWTKVTINVPFLNFRPLSFLKSDEALLEIDGRLILYNPKEGSHRELAIHGINGGRNPEIETYVESLVSPKLWQWELEEV